MQEDNQNRNPVANKHQKYKFINKTRIIILAVGLAACGLVVAAWFVQQQRINDLSQQNNKLTSADTKTRKDLELKTESNEQLRKQVDELNKEISNLKGPEQAKLTLAINEAKHEPKPDNVTYDGSVNDLIYIDITVTNTDKALDGYFSQSGLTLKNEENNNRYPLCQNSVVSYRCSRGLEVPGGKSELLSQNIAAGDVVRGVIGFYVPKDLKTATLSYDGADFELRIQNSQGSYDN